VRKPAKIVEEMLHLNRHHGVRVFLFQDDDFPLWGLPGRRWADELVDRIHESGLVERTLWKISCRAEYVDPDLFSKLREAGLFLVYMGIESGVEQGLEVLNKEMTVEQNLRGVQTLKDVGIIFGYGFMLFDPSSSFDSIRENIGFLRAIVGDGSAAATFSRMLPYGGTPIRDRLQREGRLRGDLTHPDYVFLDPRINEYHRLLNQTVRPWIHHEGLSYQLNYALDELETVKRLVPGVEGIEEYQMALRVLIRESNDRLLRLVEETSIAFEAGDSSRFNPAGVRDYCEKNVTRLVAMRDSFIAENIYLLRDASSPDCASGPVMSQQIH
jgi:anaerobic magnesium-protoporphyrin IX monomethyl ester cyclase